MTAYTKADFYTLYRGWNNKVSCYIAGKFVQLTDRKLESLKDVTIDINGQSFKVTLDNVTKI